MAHSGYLVKVGNFTIPMSKIKIGSYKVTYSTLDLDSYRDATGLLHRNVLSHKVGKVEFNMPYVYESDFDSFMASIRGQYTDALEKKASVTIYVPELNEYITQDMYMPDMEISILQNSPNGLILDQPRICFIGY